MYTLPQLVKNAEENLKSGRTFEEWADFMKEEYNLSNDVIEAVKFRLDE